MNGIDFNYDDYREVLEYPYQQEEKQPKTFLEIARQPHYENVIINILAFFFDTSEEHGMRDLFLSSLLAVVAEKEGIDFTMSDCCTTREGGTRRRGRIDLLLKDSNDEKCIIIENKIYHMVNNDLDDYYNSVEGIDDEKKIGILLTLEPTEAGHPKFYNITHRTLCDQVLANIGKYYTTASDKYLHFLKDYIQNINTFYKSESMKQKIAFFLSHKEKIQNLVNLQQEILDHFFGEVEKTRGQLGFEIEKHDEYFYLNFLPKDDPWYKNFYYTVIYENMEIGAEAKLEITIELMDLEEKQISVLLKASPKFSEKYDKVNFISGPPTERWFYFAYQTYPLSSPDLLNLSEFLYEKIQDFEPVRKEVYQLLTKTTK